MQTVIQEAEKAFAQRNKAESFLLTKQLVRDFLQQKEQEGKSRQTVTSYRQSLSCFFGFLEEDKIVTERSLIQWKESMTREGYATGTINCRISAVNSLFDYLGRRNWQVTDWTPAVPPEKQELTRDAYFALLKRAREQENIQRYLLVKVLGCTDLTPGDLPLLTREAVHKGVVAGKVRGCSGDVILPQPLQAELLEYARQRGIETGPLFLNGSCSCYNRSAVTKIIQTLAEEVGLEPGLANPRNLRRLHLSTQADFQKRADAWAAEQYEKLLLLEENTIGWTMAPAGK